MCFPGHMGEALQRNNKAWSWYAFPRQIILLQNVSGEIKAFFNHATDLIKVVLMEYILDIVMEKMGTRSVDQKPADLPADDDKAGLKAYKDWLVDEVMELAWNPSSLRQVHESNYFDWINT